MNLSLERLLFDPADVDDSANVGAFLRDAAGDLITSTLIGSKQALDVNVVGDGDDGIFGEDDASTNGDKGQSILAVRQATLADSVGSDGDYAWFKLNARGALWTAPVGTVADDAADTENPVKVGSRAASGALSAVANGDRADLLSDLYRRVWINDSPNIGAAAAEVAVGTSETALPTSALAGRRRMIVQNVSSNPVYIGPTGVTTGSGLMIQKGASLSLEIGQNVALFGIASASGQNVRVFELA